MQLIKRFLNLYECIVNFMIITIFKSSNFLEKQNYFILFNTYFFILKSISVIKLFHKKKKKRL